MCSNSHSPALYHLLQRLLIHPQPGLPSHDQTEKLSSIFFFFFSFSWKHCNDPEDHLLKGAEDPRRFKRKVTQIALATDQLQLFPNETQRLHRKSCDSELLSLSLQDVC